MRHVCFRIAVVESAFVLSIEGHVEGTAMARAVVSKPQSAMVLPKALVEYRKTRADRRKVSN